MAPYIDARWVAIERGKTVLGSGDIRKLDDALNALDQADRDVDAGFRDCKRHLVKSVEDLVAPALKRAAETPPITCLVNGVVVPCEEAEAGLAL